MKIMEPNAIDIVQYKMMKYDNNNSIDLCFMTLANSPIS